MLWNNRNDLDLRVIPPSGEEVFYAHKQSRCGGWLDVDMNVRGETTKPVENTRWPKGKAPKGHYRVYVQNYAFHDESRPAATRFRVEVEVNGKIKHFEGETKRGLFGPESDVIVFEFDYDPAQRPTDTAEYAGYHDDVIKAQWASVIPQENILLIEDPHAIIDVMLGALALAEGTVDLDTYLIDMGKRGQTALRLSETAKALEGLAGTKALAKVDMNDLPDKGEGKTRKGKSQRL